MADREAPASLTLASFNIHMGVDGWGRPFDVVGQCAGLDADVLVLQESWNPDGGDLSTAAAVAEGLGYQLVAEVGLARGRLFDPLPTTTTRWAPRPGLVRKSFRLDDERWAINAGPADRSSSPDNGGSPSCPGSRRTIVPSSRWGNCDAIRRAGR